MPPSSLSTRLFHPTAAARSAQLVARFDGLKAERTRLRIRGVISPVFEGPCRSARSQSRSSSFITVPAVSYRSLRVRHDTINASGYRSIDSRVFIMDCGRCVTRINTTIPILVFNVDLLLRGVTDRIVQINARYYFCNLNLNK